MNRTLHIACLIALPLALAACGKKEPDAKAEPAGEILPGSIDDAMLPLDSVRSQPPLAPQTEPATKAGKVKEGADAADEEASGEASDGVATATDPAPAIAIPAASPAPAITTPTKAQ